jgi:molybdopterin-guanine dinucleotide biosynthesis protein A
VIFDAIVLSGGRASRLGGIDKSALEIDGRSLLDLVLDAAAGARSTVVVGSAPNSERYDVVREEPAFGGPAAALHAGVARLSPEGDDVVLVLAGDLPRVKGAVAVLLGRIATSGPAVDGVIAVDAEGRLQYLTAAYRAGALRRALDGVAANDSMRRVVGALRLDGVAVPAGTTHDVDTWQDAESLGITRKADL